MIDGLAPVYFKTRISPAAFSANRNFGSMYFHANRHWAGVARDNGRSSCESAGKDPMSHCTSSNSRRAPQGTSGHPRVELAKSRGYQGIFAICGSRLSSGLLEESILPGSGGVFDRRSAPFVVVPLIVVVNRGRSALSPSVAQLTVTELPAPPRRLDGQPLSRLAMRSSTAPAVMKANVTGVGRRAVHQRWPATWWHPPRPPCC